MTHDNLLSGIYSRVHRIIHDEDDLMLLMISSAVISAVITLALYIGAVAPPYYPETSKVIVTFLILFFASFVIQYLAIGIARFWLPDRDDDSADNTVAGWRMKAWLGIEREEEQEDERLAIQHLQHDLPKTWINALNLDLSQARERSYFALKDVIDTCRRISNYLPDGPTPSIQRELTQHLQAAYEGSSDPVRLKEIAQAVESAVIAREMANAHSA